MSLNNTIHKINLQLKIISELFEEGKDLEFIKNFTYNKKKIEKDFIYFEIGCQNDNSYFLVPNIVSRFEKTKEEKEYKQFFEEVMPGGPKFLKKYVLYIHSTGVIEFNERYKDSEGVIHNISILK